MSIYVFLAKSELSFLLCILFRLDFSKSDIRMYSERVNLQANEPPLFVGNGFCHGDKISLSIRCWMFEIPFVLFLNHYLHNDRILHDSNNHPQQLRNNQTVYDLYCLILVYL